MTKLLRKKLVSFLLLLFLFERPEQVANRQYVLMYPSYQFVSTRQDAPANPFQTFLGFIGFGQAGQNTQMMDAVEMDKPETQPQSQPPQNSVDSASEKNPSKQKLYYSFATPASTVPLNTDQRFFYLAEQPQLFGAYSGSTVNPAFNLQPVPIVLSRSNVAQPDETVAQSNKVNSENVQKFSQIPPVMAVGVDPVSSQVQGKSVVGEEVGQVSTIVDNNQDLVNVKHVSIVDQDPLPESKINPAPPVVAVEDNRAVPVVTESSVEVKSAAVVETRSNPVPIVVSSESVVAPVVSPPTDQNIEVKDSVQSAAEVGTTLKELHSVHPVSHVDSAVVAPVVQAVVDQNVPHGEKVEHV